MKKQRKQKFSAFSAKAREGVMAEINDILAIAVKHAQKSELDKMDAKIKQAKIWASDYGLQIRREIHQVLQQIPFGTHLNIPMRVAS